MPIVCGSRAAAAAAVKPRAGVEQDRARKMQEGRAAFNRGEFFLAHELWEVLWLDLRQPLGRSKALRLRVQGLIQIAAGLHHLQSGRRRPATTLLRRGLAKLTPVRDAPVEGAPVEGASKRHSKDQTDLVDRSELWPEATISTFCRDLTQFIARLENQHTVPPDPALLQLGVIDGSGDAEPV
jgi:hypothetical protein